MPPSLDLGKIRVDVIPCGEFRLDGGAMFGQVPRPRWETLAKPDERHRVVMGTNALLVRGANFVLLVESGCGTRWTADERAFFGIVEPDALTRHLAALGVRPEDVTHVTASHLHFDHGGGLFTGDAPDADGDLRFPNATHALQEVEFAAATKPPEFQKASYRGPFARIAERGRLRAVKGDEELVPGVRLRHSGGHTDGHQVIEMDGGADAALFFGDLLPTSWHLPPAYTMAYDLHPQQVISKKRALLDECADRATAPFLYHDPDPRPARIRRDGRRFVAERIG
jgi:glyoxylase-like metal-dependent hydrolase (beta-lactamase superfamily II)